ncbi:MAG: hypothetical protein HYX76_02575 [Acidobacteria bacterium]|nr:hypothetical protein [Acidobacteriota bacterium]
MRYHPFGHLGLKFVAIGLAVLLWLTVAREPVVERMLRVPLQFENIPARLEITGEPLGTVSVRVRSSSGVLSRLDPGEVVAVLDLKSAKPGNRLFHLMTEQVRTPFGVEVEQVLPATIPLEFQRSTEKRVPVVPALEGKPAPGYVVGKITSTPSTVVVIGPESRVKLLTEATTEPVSLQGATTTVTDRATIGLADQDVRLKDPVAAQVTVIVTSAPTDRRLRDVLVRVRNMRGGLAGQVKPGTVDLSVRGASDRLAALETDSITAYVDATGLGRGRYTLPVRADAPPDVHVTRISPATVAVRIR